MPKGIRKDGTKPVPPKERKSKPNSVAKTFRLAPDVVAILARQKNATAYTEEAVREKHERDNLTPPA